MDDEDIVHEDEYEAEPRNPSAHTFFIWVTILLLGMILGGFFCVFFLDGFLWRTEREAVYAKMDEMQKVISSLEQTVSVMSETVGRHEDAEMFKQTIEASGMQFGDNISVADRIKMIDQLWKEREALSSLSISQRLAILESAYLQRTRAIAAMRKHRTESGKSATIPQNGDGNGGGFDLRSFMERHNDNKEKGK